jgi:signal transduction histidine kinase
LLSFGILSLLLLLCFYYLYKTILHPFKKLESFAHQIASGNLEAPILMDKNNIFGAFTESFDIMREELNKAKKKEYLANKSKKELVASLSHDIKTPVTSIKLISELLLVMIKDEKINNKISSIYNKAEQIDHLVTDMFNVTLEELNELKVTVTDEYSTSLKTLFNNADFYNKITLGKIPECAIQVDILRLQQVINNVINNSYKYADTKINVDFTIDNLYLQINIKDYGQGVLDDELPLLFNKFYRGKNPNVQKQDGSGLGLYISKYLMNEMGGDINCYNESDGFKVELLIPIL